MPVTLEQVKRRIATASAGELLEPFAELLFEKARPEFLSEFNEETLYAIAVQSLNFLQDKQPGDVEVKAYNPNYQADGWDAPYSAVIINLQDRPFIFDSVKADIRRQGFEIHHVLHPILSIIRDDAGHIESFPSDYTQGVRESFQLFFISRSEDETALKNLETSLASVLHDVVLATNDYGAMVDKAQEVRRYLNGLEDSVDEALQDELAESAAFLDWLTEDNYVFLGYREYDIGQVDKTPMIQVTEGSGLGVLSKYETSAYHEPVPISDIPEGLRERVTGGKLLIVTKTNAESTVHRPARMDYIGIKKLSNGQEVLGERRFVGLFTSKALSTPVEEIPILRSKLERVLIMDNALKGSHDYKQITSIFNSMPREELFWAEAEQLHKDIRTIMGLEQERGVRLTLRPDPLGRGLAVMVIMPRERFNSEVRRSIQQHLYDELAATHVDYQLAMGEEEEQVRFHFFFTTTVSRFDVDVPELERQVSDLTRTWDDEVLARLSEAKGEHAGRQLADHYAKAFDEGYKADVAAGAALKDIENIEALGTDAYLVDVLNPVDDRWGGGATQLKIYHQDRTLVLSEVLPLLENLGLKVLEQISYFADLEEGIRGIDIFRVQTRQGELLDIREHRERLIEATEALLRRETENDRLNRLVLYGGLSIRQVSLLRSYQMYFAQVSPVTSRSFINETLLAHPDIAALLFRTFACKFDPALGENREGRLKEAIEAFSDSLNGVASLAEDRTLRGLFNLIEASVRSNYFLDKPYISFKLDSQQVSTMPEPRPLFEIAVLGPGVEAIHLRGGMVARGGIRWSDRPDDFRTEVLGLMKTQMTKNAVIVPVGSKGGFVIKHAPAEREALGAYVKAQYQTFMRGMLDITDNRLEGETVHPEGLVIYDEPDPYLVVAADKGTATFSDLANETAAEYAFWLGDAFASGGSYGYDHKEEGITARGAWECVSRHFREMGLNVFEDTFTVAGIGDMGGDVFGNGMLYTRKLKLLAAFNHLHIFLDPKPDPEASFEERKRLFEKPRSSWQDYNPELISEGGGVFERSSKSITLSPQVKGMLGVSEDALSGQDLIRALLKMEVDLLWNGGIGTYVKAGSESHTDVGDSSNDAVRVDASELQAKVVGEGGNLGFTQLARIEYALSGGRINTDAIDNSAGVDMSDHEVNIKILLQPLLESGELSFVQRNRLLEDMTGEVNGLVLKDNYRQSLALSLASSRAEQDLAIFQSLQAYLAERGGLKPAVEFLPDPELYQARQRAHEGLTRPELAILLAYVKMGLYKRLLETDFPDEPYFKHYLFDYFPEVLSERYREAIAAHPLGREIIATQFTNKVVDILGITFVHRSIRDTGASPVEVVKAALIAFEMLEVDALLERIFALDNQVAAEHQYDAIDELVVAVEGVVNWALLSDLKVASVADFVTQYREPLTKLRKQLSDYLPGPERARYDRAFEAAEQRGFGDELARDIASLDYLPSGIGVIDVSLETGVELEQAATHFYTLGERLSLGWLRDNIAALPTSSKWEKIALGGLVMDFRRAQRHLTQRFFETRSDGDIDTEAFLEQNPKLLERFDSSLADIRKNGTLSLASGGVLARLLLQAIAP